MPPILNSDVALQHHSQFSIGGVLYDTTNAPDSSILFSIAPKLEFKLIEREPLDRIAIISVWKLSKKRFDEIHMPVNGLLGNQRAFLIIFINHWNSLRKHIQKIGTDFGEDMFSYAMQTELLNSIHGIITITFCVQVTDSDTFQPRNRIPHLNDVQWLQ